MIFCYSDPPYLNQARRHYRADPLCAEVDHAALIATLQLDYPDGWALSCSSPSLKIILPMCPASARVAAWVKPFCSFKPGVNPAYAWEPVIFCGGRARAREETTIRDWVSANITLQRGTHGAKPRTFCYWLFDLLNAQPGDELHDLYPGSGAVGRAWEEYIAMKANAPLQLEMWRDAI